MSWPRSSAQLALRVDTIRRPLAALRFSASNAMCRCARAISLFSAMLCHGRIYRRDDARAGLYDDDNDEEMRPGLQHSPQRCPLLLDARYFRPLSSSCAPCRQDDCPRDCPDHSLRGARALSTSRIILYRVDAREGVPSHTLLSKQHLHQPIFSHSIGGRYLPARIDLRRTRACRPIQVLPFRLWRRKHYMLKTPGRAERAAMPYPDSKTPASWRRVRHACTLAADYGRHFRRRIAATA